MPWLWFDFYKEKEVNFNWKIAVWFMWLLRHTTPTKYNNHTIRKATSHLFGINFRHIMSNPEHDKYPTVIPLCPLLAITFLARLHWVPLMDHMCKLAKADDEVCQFWEATQNILISYSAIKNIVTWKMTAYCTSFSYECTWSETEKRLWISICSWQFYLECVSHKLTTATTIPITVMRKKGTST